MTKNLQILVHPMLSKQELNADSNYINITIFIRAMNRVRPDWQFVMPFPDDKSGFTYQDDGFFKLPNVTRVPQRVSPRKMTNAISYDGSWYDKLFRSMGFDVIWSNLVEISGHMAYAGHSTYEPAGRPVVINTHNYVIHKSLPYPMESMLNVAYAQVGGAVLADWNIFSTDHCKAMFLDTAQRWLHEQAIAAILEKSSQIPHGPIEPPIKPVPHQNAVPVIAYNHRLQGYKNPKPTFEAFAKLHAEGIPFKVRFFRNTNEKLSQIQHYPFVEIVTTVDRASYLKALSTCDLNVTNSMHETFGISCVESMGYGQPVIAPRAVTFPEITGQQELGYPYLFDTEAEQLNAMRILLTDHAERQRWGERLSDYVHKQYGSDIWAQRYASLFEELTVFTLNPSPDGREWCALQLKKHSGSTLHEMFNFIAHQEVNGRIPFSNQSLPYPKLLRMIRMLGGTVRIEKGIQRVYAEGKS